MGHNEKENSFTGSWISSVEFLHIFRPAVNPDNKYHCLLSAARQAWLHSGSSRNGSNPAITMPPKAGDRHRCGLTSPAPTPRNIGPGGSYAWVFPRTGKEVGWNRCEINTKASQNPTAESEYFSACYKMDRKDEINLQVSTCETRLSKTIVSADWGGVCVGKVGKENMVSPGSRTLNILHCTYIGEKWKTSRLHAVKSQLHFWDYLWQSWKSY